MAVVYMGIMVMGNVGGCGLHGDNGNGECWWLWSTWG